MGIVFCKKYLVVVLFFWFNSSCSFLEQDSIAKCDGNVLTEEDYLNFLESFDLSDQEDVKTDFIESWILTCLTKKELKGIDENTYLKNKFRAEDFFRNKNLFELENRYIDQNIDTLVTEKQIIDHYRENRSNYVRQSFIVKALYIKVLDSITENEKIEASFLLKNDKDKENINKYGNLYGLSFYWEEDKWIFLDDLIREIPITERVKEDLVIKKGEGIFTDEDYRYYLNIMDYRIKESKEPLTFERKEIKNHILKRRVNALRDEANQKIIKELYEKYDFSIDY